MNYLEKLSPFSIKEKFKLIQYTIGSLLVNSVPNALKFTYHFTNKLSENKVSFESKNGFLNLTYLIDGVGYDFKLKKSTSDVMVFD